MIMIDTINSASALTSMIISKSLRQLDLIDQERLAPHPHNLANFCCSFASSPLLAIFIELGPRTLRQFDCQVASEAGWIGVNWGPPCGEATRRRAMCDVKGALLALSPVKLPRGSSSESDASHWTPTQLRLSIDRSAAERVPGRQ